MGKGHKSSTKKNTAIGWIAGFAIGAVIGFSDQMLEIHKNELYCELEHERELVELIDDKAMNL